MLKRVLDDVPGKSTHLLLRLVPSLEPIGTIRMVHLSATEKKLGRLCVLKEYRNFKLGKDLVLTAHDYLLGRRGRTSDSLSVSLHSQIYVKGFYVKWVLIGTHETLLMKLPLGPADAVIRRPYVLKHLRLPYYTNFLSLAGSRV
jgi:predicted GNAT family N-acyltransferase